MAFVVDQSERLLGVLSDGDLRRAILKGAELTEPVKSYMRTDPQCANEGDDRRTILQLMKMRGVSQLPVLNIDRVLVGLEMIDDYLVPSDREEWVVIMAGGLGKRLKELTQHTPKPMLKVGSRPLLETIIHGFADQGFKKFVISVNYKAEQIEQYFKDGRALGLDILYVRESSPMGTAGSLSLLPDCVTGPFFVTNADLLTKNDFNSMMNAHIASGADATVGVRPYQIEVPFGVVKEYSGVVSQIEEKPVIEFTVSAGINVFSEKAKSHLSVNEPLDMPAFIERLIAKGCVVKTSCVQGYWLDVGRVGDYEKANQDFLREFE